MSTAPLFTIGNGLLVSLLGGVLFSVLRLPLPWMLGPLFATAAVSIRSWPVAALNGGRQAGQLIIGCVLGQTFTPEVGRYVLSHLGLIIGAALAALFIGYLSGLVLTRSTRTDPITAFFSSLPGGASEMVVLADRFGAKVDKVALAHSIRVPMVVGILPFLLIWSGTTGIEPYHSVAGVFDLKGLLLLFAGGAGASLAIRALKIPNAWMFGPLFLSIVLTLFEYRTSAVPSFLVNAGQLLIGCSLGARFIPSFIKEAPRYAAGVVLGVGISLGLAGGLGIFIGWWGGIPLTSTILGTAPGGMAEMCITAKVLKFSVPLVTSFHLTRLIFVLTLSGPAVKIARAAAGILPSRLT